ncbi:MAG: fatty acid desaturase [Verrucomicrobiota bacterium]
MHDEAMKEGKALILATARFAVEHKAKSWWCVGSTALLLGLAVGGTLWNQLLLSRLVCSVLSGFLIVRLFVIYHDHQHDAILSGSRLADALMRVFGMLFLSPSSIWRSSHNHHHHHNSKLRGSHIGSYPIMTKDRYLSSTRGERIKYLFMRHPLTILFGYVFVFLYGMCVYPFFNHPRKHVDSLVSLALHLSLGLALVWFAGWQALVLTLIIPHFVACAIGSYLFYAQHNFPGVTFRDNAGWTYEGAALESSSFMKMNALMRWFTANIGYHHIHHLNARIPFYRLPEVMQKMKELQHPKTTSLNPLDIIRCLRLKVWDVEAQKLISLGQMRT